MLATLLIVFREIIEAGLIIGIVLAATRGVPGRGKWVSYGILGGLIGACLVASFAGAISNMMEGVGQEVFTAGLLAVAVLMLTWHNVWMAREGRRMVQEMKDLGAAVVEGRRSLTALAIVIGVAVLREGSEIVLFLYSILLSGGNSVFAMGLGGLLGLALGAGVSATMYFGLLRIPTRHLFAVTGGLISLLAAGMAAQAALCLQQAGLVNVLTRTLWDTSFILASDSIIGKALHTLIGYTDHPTGIQLLAYAATLATISILSKILAHPPQTKAAIKA